MTHPDYQRAHPSIRYDGPIGPELWRTLEIGMKSNVIPISGVVTKDGLRVLAYYDRGVNLEVRIERRGDTTDDAWEEYVASIWAILPAGNWRRSDMPTEPGYRMTTIEFVGPSTTKEDA